MLMDVVLSVKGVVPFSLVVVGDGFVVVVCGNAEVVLVVVELVLIKVVASGIGSVVSLLGRTDVEVWVELDELSVGKVSKGTKEKSVLVELGLAVDGASVAGCEVVCEGFLSGIASDGLSLLEEPPLPMISEEIGILTTKGSSSFRPLLLLLLLGPPVLLCLST